MPKVTGYHRPASVADALAMLDAPGPPKVLLAGGTTVNAGLERNPIEVVDLQDLGLGGIEEDGDRLRIGATTTLEELTSDPRVPGVLRDLARAEAPSTLRAMGTLGGLIATADPESELLAGLLVYGAAITTVDGDGTDTSALADVLAEGLNGIITHVHIETEGATAAARTARTPGDRPIVAAVARKANDTTYLAMTGVAATPLLIDEYDNLNPPGDFRGSSDYRLHLAKVLGARVLEEVGR